MSRIVTGYIGPIRYEDLRFNGRRPTKNVREWTPQRMTLAELLVFVKSAANDEFFFAEFVLPVNGEWDVACSFPALSFLLEVPNDARRKIGTCYERRDRQAGTTRGGYPMFTTVQFIHVDDWHPARDLIAAEVVRRRGRA